MDYTDMDITGKGNQTEVTYNPGHLSSKGEAYFLNGKLFLAEEAVCQPRSRCSRDESREKIHCIIVQ
ncbi:MAG TPA: hypothetical protein VFB79_01360, partial [Candidatus Angelobacter sp.]|nr:hypothetical protein [Candidatus Angelobacter sp.]